MSAKDAVRSSSVDLKVALKVAVIGATGAVGREMLADLAESSLSLEVVPLASPRSDGDVIEFRGKAIKVRAFSAEAIRGCRYALMSAGGDFSRSHALAIAESGTIVIDNSSAWRMDPEVPLIVPEVNAHELTPEKIKKGIIANPNCSTIQMVVPLAALERAFGVSQVTVSSYQSVSGTGQKGISELAGQVQGHFTFKEPEPEVYAHPIAFNLIPAIDRLDESGHCFEEEKIIRETRRILGKASLPIMAATVRTPTFHCHGETVAVQLGREVSLSEARDVLAAADGVTYVDGTTIADMPTPRSVAGDKGVWVSRLRLPLDTNRSSWLQFWVVADNLKKGAATNAVQILESLNKLV